ncbi:MAG: hypothetical protein BWZ02_02560 [Lentisphaerae bacterium ADurb.BinA184]|nr:MAG: hypothetical protein BWZ02_02560 [Lentisphaerae bacterium ADurb.BinA184]
MGSHPWRAREAGWYLWRRRLWAEVPEVRFVLWTNGQDAPDDLPGQFDQVHVTTYEQKSLRVKELVPHARVWAPTPDRRLNAKPTPDSPAPCLRPFVEMVVDFYGNIHACCYDWRGDVPLGNVHDAPFAWLVQRWQGFRDLVAGPAMADGAPTRCRTCPQRARTVADFVPEVASRARAWLAARNGPAVGTTPGVVLVHYRMPADRLRLHLERNAAAYEGAQVYVVTEQPVQIAGAECVPFPAARLPVRKGRPVFSLAATKSAGVARALDAGCDPVIVTDSDVEIPPDTMAWFRQVPAGAARIARYVMRTWPGRLDAQDHEDTGCTGTLAMRASHWRRLRFDERCVGYGGEDGALLAAIRGAGLATDRSCHVLHHAHTPGHNPRRVPGSGIPDCWNRDSGFNPNLFAVNVKARQCR